ncbi:MAG: alpha/beta hydrolase [Clostridiales bacterium]|nr:alpha/beta hydrolase [Clostridiales bacterium]
MKDTIITIAIVVAAVLCLILIIGGIIYWGALTRNGLNFVKRVASNISRKKSGGGRNPDRWAKYRRYPDYACLKLIETDLESHSDRIRGSIIIKNKYGENCHGYIYDLKPDNRKWAIACHGYSSSPGGMGHIALYYRDRGFNVIVPSMRGHGENEHSKITMGYKDKDDLIGFINYIVERQPDAEIVIHGISMGAVTVMLATGEELPANVKCAVEDCGFAYAKTQFRHKAKQMVGFLAAPAVGLISLYMKINCGFSLKDINPVDAVKKSKTPTLFIHGTADGFIPVEAVNINYNACAAEKELVLFEGADHADSSKDGYNEYFEKVTEFTEKYMFKDEG